MSTNYRENLNIEYVYEKLVERLSRKHKSVQYLPKDDPYNLLIGFIALAHTIEMTYISKIIDNKYVRYPIIDIKSNLNVLENFGIRPSPIIPSSITLTIEYVEGLLESYVTIPYNTRFRILSDDFVTFYDYYLLPNNSYTSVTAYKGIIREEDFGLSDIVNQKIQLYYNNVVSDKVIVIVDSTEYKYVDYCLYRKGTNIFGIEYEYPDNFYISFPSNYLDYIGPYSRISVRYLTSDDTITYDPTQESVELGSDIYDLDGNNIKSSFEIYNIESFTYGDKRHTTDFCYKNLGRLLSTFGKAVTTEDYKILTDYYPGVAVSAAYDINSTRRMDPFIYIQIPYYTKVVVAPTENYYPTEYLKKELYDYYDKVGVDRNQVYIQIIDPRYRIVDISVGIQSEYLTNEEILESYNLIYSAIKEFFRVGNLEFGCTLEEDVILSVVIGADSKLIYSESVALIDYDTVYCEADELPILGRLSIIFSYREIRFTDDDGEFIEFNDERYLLERRIPGETLELVEGDMKVGPITYDKFYFSDVIYKDSDMHTNITIIRFTNYVSEDNFECELNYEITDTSEVG